LRRKPAPESGRTLVIGCGALGRELVALTRPLPEVDLACLPATLHNRPDGIPGAVRDRIRRARAEGYDRVFVAYADCGTGGLLDRVVAEGGVERLPGAHCYEVYAGRAAFAALQDEEPGTFYLTDFLVRQFETLVLRGLGLDRHPELLPVYFANYRRVVYLAQTDDPALTTRAKAAADRLGLAFERRVTGYGDLMAPIALFGRAVSATRPSDAHPRRMPHGTPSPHQGAGLSWEASEGRASSSPPRFPVESLPPAKEGDLGGGDGRLKSPQLSPGARIRSAVGQEPSSLAPRASGSADLAVEARFRPRVGSRRRGAAVDLPTGARA
jgi:hypothetical protein